jgi:hypothetical protein
MSFDPTQITMICIIILEFTGPNFSIMANLVIKGNLNMNSEVNQKQIP